MTRLFNNALLILFGFFLGGALLLITTPPRGEPVSLRPAPPARVVVHVAGGVVQPGVYELAAGARVRDAIAAAGGLESGGSATTVNLAALLTDGDQVVVPARGPQAGPGMEPVEPPAGSLININTATQAELEELPGIGPSIAARIIEYREQNGPFSKAADIVRVSGIGPSTYGKIKDRITTEP